MSPLLRSKHPLNLEQMDAAELRLCRIVDGDQVIDDCLVCVRKASDPFGWHGLAPAKRSVPETGRGMTTPTFIIEISLHGGPRIVQRVLLLLRKAGADIVEPTDLLDRVPAEHPIAQDAYAALLRAKTRPVAAWLVRTKDRLPGDIHRVIDLIDSNKTAAASTALESLLAAAPRIRFLLDGIRVVLVGPPNAGKSTLANTLAAREHAIVSETPGTTRDFLEIPAAIAGVPVTLIDTAGLRETADPIEQEAIRRTFQQAGAADLILHLQEACASHDAPSLRAPDMQTLAPSAPTAELRVWTKADQLAAPATEAPPHTLLVSAHTGQGIDELRAQVLAAFGLTDWSALIGPFTSDQSHALTDAHRALAAEPPDRPRARKNLTGLIRK